MRLRVGVSKLYYYILPYRKVKPASIGKASVVEPDSGNERHRGDDEISEWDEYETHSRVELRRPPWRKNPRADWL